MPATLPSRQPARRTAKRLRHTLAVLACVAAITAAKAVDKSLDLRFAALSMGDSTWATSIASQTGKLLSPRTGTPSSSQAGSSCGVTA